jgi:hypothetical protein
MGWVSTLLFAVLTDRAFLILEPNEVDKCESSSLSDGFIPQFLNWSMPILADGRNISALLISDNSQDFRFQSSFYNLSVSNLLSPKNVEALRRLRLQSLSEFPPMREADVYLTRMDRGVTIELFGKDSLHRDALTAMGLTAANAFPCLFQLLFRMSPDACGASCREAERRLAQAGREGVERIGVQISIECSAAPQYMFCLDSLLYSLESRGQGALILLLADSLHIQKLFVERYGTALILPSGNPVPPKDFIPLELLEKQFKSFEECSRIRDLDSHNTRSTASHAYLFSLTDVQIVSTNGALGIFGAFSRPRKQRIMYGISAIHTERKLCNASSTGDPLSMFSDSWKGI